MKALGISERARPARFVSQQVYYSLQARDAETELVPVAIDQGLGILVWSPIAGGLLSGKYRRGVEAPAGSRHLERVGRAAGPRRGQALRHHRGARRDRRGARRLGGPGRAGLHCSAKPAVTSVIVGARTEEQLADNLAAADLTLTADELARLDEVSAQPLRYPYWHQAKTSGGRLSPADLSLLGRHL